MRFILIILIIFALGQISVRAQFKDSLEDFDYKKEDDKKKNYVPDYDETILKNGFFIDGLIPYASVSITRPTSIYEINSEGGGIGIRLGNKWYIGNMKTYRPGFAAIWGRANIILVKEFQSGLYPYISIAPVNIGFINAFSFGGELGLEVNFNFGLNTIIDMDYSSFIFGYLANPTIKFRYRSFAVGLDVAIMAGDYLDGDQQAVITLIGLTIGGKF